MSSRSGAWALGTLVAVLGDPSLAAAQSVRVTGATSLHYVELRTFVRDSVPLDAAGDSGVLRQLPGGRIVRCIPGDAFCQDVRPGSVVSTVPVFHDIEVSAWGFGEGIRLVTQVRARSTWGRGGALWPRGDDSFDLLAAYAALERERVRVRAGRQWKVSGLGFYNFDGLAVAARAATGLWLEGYAGRSLVRGLNEPRTGDALESIEALAVPNGGVLLGAQARYRPNPRLALSALYQIDVREDRRGIHSELAVVDGVLLAGRGSVEGSLEADVAGDAINQARLSLRSPPIGRVALFGEVRRYRPYFELWTIWGAFSPVGFDEARSGMTWSDREGRLILRGEGAYRRYAVGPDDGALGDLRDDGWQIGSSASWSPASAWRLDASYRTETGVGAARRDAHAGLLHQLRGGGSVALQALLFQRLYEFRLDEGTVVGLGGELALPLPARMRMVATAATYRHLDRGQASMDWSQRRASVRLQWVVGAEPGVRPRPGGTP